MRYSIMLDGNICYAQYDTILGARECKRMLLQTWGNNVKIIDNETREEVR